MDVPCQQARQAKKLHAASERSQRLCSSTYPTAELEELENEFAKLAVDFEEVQAPPSREFELAVGLW